ncbi:MAG: gamma-glutamyltransferase [Flammeovirgaceae bacterium]|nr:gamma-glutamyltransferase [Flammeovirgaceae bacterium]
MNRFYFLLVVIATVACNSASKRVRTHGLIADSAMVVSAHPIASQIGVDIIHKGGNAVDAAIAVQFALTVVFPEAGNIGGGGFMVYRQADGGLSALDFRERAPAQSSRDMYLDSAGNVVEGLSTYGHLSSGIPGSVDGMIVSHQKYGSLPWRDLVQPAINLALNGHVLTEKASNHINDIQDDLRKYNSVMPEFLLREWHAGDTIKWENLGHTLERIRDQGRAGFYEGKTADDLVSEMKRGKGIITHDDLKNYKSRWLEPITANYKDYKIISMPPPSSGGIAVIQMLKSIEPYPIKEWGHNSAKTVHLLTEVERRAFADRSVYLGDPDFFNVPSKELIADSYIRQRMSDFSMERASVSSTIREGKIVGYESSETTHISIVDTQGNAVAITTTLNDWFGSRIVVAGSGFFLNDEMDDFSMKPGVPNVYGLIGGKGNEIQPGKTMLSSMTPTIIEKNGQLFMVVGSPGGSRIITSVFQTIVNVLEFDMTMQEAVNAKKIHSQWLPDAIFPEPGALLKDDSLRLVSMKHSVKQLSDLEERLTSLGRVDAVLKRADKKLEGGADPRGDDAARGY